MRRLFRIFIAHSHERHQHASTPIQSTIPPSIIRQEYCRYRKAKGGNGELGLLSFADGPRKLALDNTTVCIVYGRRCILGTMVRRIATAATSLEPNSNSCNSKRVLSTMGFRHYQKTLLSSRHFQGI
mmetsp:Transcript_18852/g.46702  ORF Transcript_18852/g.46702 Transcript_18852/m.46702 type:complete len:127 (+) Transcript_18852:194-574(+)